MKTTLKYNTIETFQRQTAWKKFIDTIVDACKGLFDDHLVAEFEEGENVTKKRVNSITQEDEYLSISNIKLSESNEDIVPQMELSELQPKYSVLSYLEDGIPLTLKENISLKGLLRTLNLYGCRIKDINFYKDFLPHTYKISRDIVEVENIYGFYEQSGVTYDFSVQATVDGDSGQNVDGIIGDIDIDDDLRNKYKYKENIYGYNQKHPAISKINAKTFKEFFWYKKKTDAEYKQEYPVGNNNPTGLDLIPNNLYIDKDVIIEENKYYYPIYYSNNESAKIVKLVSNELNVHLGNATHLNQILSANKQYIYTSALLERCYILQNNVKLIDDVDFLNFNELKEIIENIVFFPKNIKLINQQQPSFIINNKAVDDSLSDNGYVEYNNSDSQNIYNVIFNYKDNTGLTIFTKKFDINNNPITITDYDGKIYYVYEDNFMHQEWCFMNEVEPYFNISLPFLKNQLFADECTIKAQPLFEYYSHSIGTHKYKISTCANFINTLGGENKITYEVELYNKRKILTPLESINNTSNVADIIVKSVYNGNYYFKWEQFNVDGNYIKDVYTALNFESRTQGESSSLAYFFDGERNIYPIDTTAEDYTNNKKKVIGEYTYINANKQEYFEAMYFNHFIKISPIISEKDFLIYLIQNTSLIEDNRRQIYIDAVKNNEITPAIKMVLERVKENYYQSPYDIPYTTTNLYCDNLELVEFGNIVPYIVTYDRIGRKEVINNIESNMYDDIDCSIFSKILSYNKRTHLITVDEPVVFENIQKGKYAVVAYENASPFNKISDIFISAPNNNVKELTKSIVKDFVNQNCNLWIKDFSNLLLGVTNANGNPTPTDCTYVCPNDKTIVITSTNADRFCQVYYTKMIPNYAELEGKEVTFSIESVSKSNVNSIPRVYLYNNGGTLSKLLYDNQSTANGYSYTFTFPTIPNGTTQVGLIVRANQYNSGGHINVGDTVTFVGLKLEKGSKATEWSPAPEESSYEQIE